MTVCHGPTERTDNQEENDCKKIQQLCGYLNFLSKAIFPGRSFTHRMYAKFSEVINIGGAPKDATQYKFNQHYHLRLDAEFKLDCQVWIDFLSSNLAQVVNRPMVDLFCLPEDSMDIGFYSDASGSKDLGFGALLGSDWLRGDWGSDFITQCEPSIEFLELYVLMAGILAWENHSDLNNKRVKLHCDNKAVVHMINNMTSFCKNCMVLIRVLVLNGLKFNRKLTACYISTKDNFLSDPLSWNQMSRFWSLAPANMSRQPTKLPEVIWPISKIWLK